MNEKVKKVLHHPNISKNYKSNGVLYEQLGISNHFHLLVEVKWLTLNDRKRKCLTRQ